MRLRFVGVFHDLYTRKRTRSARSCCPVCCVSQGNIETLSQPNPQFDFAGHQSEACEPQLVSIWLCGVCMAYHSFLALFFASFSVRRQRRLTCMWGHRRYTVTNENAATINSQHFLQCVGTVPGCLSDSTSQTRRSRNKLTDGQALQLVPVLVSNGCWLQVATEIPRQSSCRWRCY